MAWPLSLRSHFQLTRLYAQNSELPDRSAEWLRRGLGNGTGVLVVVRKTRFRFLIALIVCMVLRAAAEHQDGQSLTRPTMFGKWFLLVRFMRKPSDGAGGAQVTATDQKSTRSHKAPIKRSPCQRFRRLLRPPRRPDGAALRLGRSSIMALRSCWLIRLQAPISSMEREHPTQRRVWG